MKSNSSRESRSKKIRTEDKELKYQYGVMEKLYKALSDGKKINEVLDLNEKEKEIIKKLFLITSKPELFVCNVSERDLVNGNNFTKELETKFGNTNSKIIYISTLIESEISLWKYFNEDDIGLYPN